MTIDFKYFCGLVMLFFAFAVFAQFQVLSAFRQAKQLDPALESLWCDETVEAYAVYKDHQLIGTSRFPDRIEAAEGVIDTDAVKSALEGKMCFWLIRDYGGAWVLSAWGPAELNGERIAVMAERDLNEFLWKLAWPMGGFFGYSLLGFVLYGSGKKTRSTTSLE